MEPKAKDLEARPATLNDAASIAGEAWAGFKLTKEQRVYDK